ncbi:hypothetical protein RYX36_003689, partial [Vicia faba]
VQTPNCICQTVFDDVALDYQDVTVLFDATTAATPDIHLVNMEELFKIYKSNMYRSKQSSLGMELVREMDGDSNMGSRKHYYESQTFFDWEEINKTKHLEFSFNFKDKAIKFKG